MTRIILSLVVAVFSSIQSIAEDNTYNPKPEYAFSNRFEADAESEAPSQTFPLSNGDFQRFYASRAEVNKRQSHTGLPGLRALQKKYDETLGRFAGQFKDEPEMAEGAIDEATLQALEWSLEIPVEVVSGESVPLKLRLRNASNRDIIYTRPASTELLPLMMQSAFVTRADESKTPVVLRRQGAYWQRPRNIRPGVRFAKESRPAGKTDDGTNPDYGLFQLDEFFDLNEPGEYELTFYTRRFVDENGALAEDPVREYPRKAIVRFTILPREVSTPGREIRIFNFATAEEARTQTYKPTELHVLNNAELNARANAAATTLGFEPGDFFESLASYEAYYDSCVNSLVDRLGLDRPAERTERLAGLKWRISTPTSVSLGKPVVMKLRLESVSWDHKYQLSKGDGMLLFAQLCSIKLVRFATDGTETEPSFTEYGAALFNQPRSFQPAGGTNLSPLSFSGGTILVPGKPVELRLPEPYNDEVGLDLAKFYDLSQPGEYELTFYTRRFVDENGKPAEDPVRQWPLPDTVRFRIVEEEQAVGDGQAY